MRGVHAHLTAWMERCGMTARVDDAGNLRGVYPGSSRDAPRLFIGSHLDTVVAGRCVRRRARRRAGDRASSMGWNVSRLPFAIEVVGFSEEEGVRFGVPFIGSRALVGSADEELLDRRDAHGRSIADAIRDYGLDPSNIARGRAPTPTRSATSNSTSSRAPCSTASESRSLSWTRSPGRAASR